MFTQNCMPTKWSRGVASVGLAAALSLGAATAFAETSNSHPAGVSQQELKAVERGWSAKKDFIDKAVYNDNNDKIGNIDDMVFSRGKSAGFAIIGVGGFLGMGTHDVAVPLSQLKHHGDKLVLPGATKDALKAMPEFQYARNERTDTRTSAR